MGMPVRAAMRPTTGRNRAAAPTFCMKLEMKPTVPDTAGMMRASVWPASFRITPATRVMSPVLSRPAPMIMTPMMEITALPAKPWNRSLVGTSGWARPRASLKELIIPSSTITVTAATSTGTTSKANR